MRIALVSADDSKLVKIGGKHIHQEQLERGLLKLGHSAVTAYPKPRIRIVEKILRRIGVSEIIRYRLKLRGLLSRIARSYAKNAGRVDFALAQDAPAAVAVSRAMKRLGCRVPLILTLHGYFARESQNYCGFREDASKAILDLNREIEREAFRAADKVIAVDSRISRYAREMGFAGPILVLFNAVDTERFRPVSREEMLAIRRRLSLPADRPIVLAARRLVSKNGMAYAIEACALLERESEKPPLFLVVGSGPERRELGALANRLEVGSLRFVEAIDHDDVDLYYKACDFVVLPSIAVDGIEEATSLTMLEGMACAKVVVASAIGGMKEVIRDGETGFLVPDRSPRAIADAIGAVIARPGLAEAIGRSARDYAVSDHGYIGHARRYAEFSADKGSGERVD